jgi:NAD(P)H-dependent flavin oxidoreductase YrpB (nitropropane dioxygenase family)
VTVYLDCQHGAFHGTNPELGWAMFGYPRLTVASAFDGHSGNDGSNMPTCRSPRCTEREARGDTPRRDRLRGEILATHKAGRPDETLLSAGQTAGGIKQILRVAEIMRRLVAETEAALSRAEDFR